MASATTFGAAAGRLVRSIDAGATFAVISGTGGLPSTQVFDLAADPSDLNRFYAATASGIFRSGNGGVNWTNVTPPGGAIGAATTNIELAVHANAGGGTNALYVGVINTGRLATISRSANLGAGWTALDVPEIVENTANAITNATNATPIVITSTNHGQRTNDRVQVTGVTGNTAANGTWTVTLIDANQFSLNGSVGNGAYTGGGTWRAVQGLQPNEHPGAQGSIHFSILAHPTNPNLVFVGGDRQPLSRGANAGSFPNAIGATNFTGRLFRGDVAQPAGSQWTPLTNNFADPDGAGVGQPGTSPHADSREIVFDAAGNLIETDDGGVYRRTNPTANTGVWTSLNGNLQITEFLRGSLAYDPLNNVIFGGTQDVGSIQQATAGGSTWDTLNQGDGSTVQEAVIGGNSVRYASSQNLGGGPGGLRRRTYNASNVLLSNVGVGLNVVGFGSLYTVDTGIQFTNPLELNAINPTRLVFGTTNALYESTDQGDNLTRLNLGTGVTPGFTRAIAYGGAGNAEVIYFGGNIGNSELLVRTTAGGAFTSLSATFPGFFTRDIAVDPGDWRIAYVIDFNGLLWRTTDAGATAGGWTQLTGNFNTLDGEARTITAMPGVVLVGGRSGAYFMRTTAPGVWREVGAEMPNVPVNDLRYDATDDVLTSGTLGRGAWSIAGITAALAEAVAPIATLAAVTPDPRNTAVSSIAIAFSEAVNGFDLADLALVRNGLSVSLNAALQTLSTFDGINWVLGNLSGLTATAGSYALSLAAGVSGIFDGAGNALAGGATEAWHFLSTFDELVVDGGTSQRSMVRSLTVVLNGTIATAPASAFEVRRLSGGPVGNFGVVVDAITPVAGNQTEIRLTFTGPGLAGGPLGSLPDGNFQITVNGGLVLDSSGFAADADGNGTAGGLRVLAFHRFFGDSNGTGLVDAVDYVAFRAAYQTGNAVLFAIYDANGDGVFTSADLDVFNANFRRRRLT